MWLGWSIMWVWLAQPIVALPSMRILGNSQQAELILTGSGDLTPVRRDFQNYQQYPIDLSGYKSGDLSIEITIGKGKCGCSCDLFAEGTPIPTQGRPTNSLRGLYDIYPDRTVTLRYHFDRIHRFVFGIEGNWLSAPGTRNTYSFRATVIGERTVRESETTTLRDIPSIMKALKWNKGAAVLNNWFNGTARKAKALDKGFDFSLPVVRVADLNIRFATQTPSGMAAYKGIKNPLLWSENQAVGREILATYSSQFAGIMNGKRVPFGGKFGLEDVGGRMEEFHRQEVRFAPVNNYAFPWTDQTASLGNFAFYAIPKGFASFDTTTRSYVFEITDIAVYVLDSFSFNGEQELGWWAKPDHMPTPRRVWEGSVEASNEAFNRYRLTSGHGGDFLIFVPAEITHFSTPVRIRVKQLS